MNIKNKRLLDGWQWVKLGELAIAGPSNGIFKQRHEFGRGVPIVNVYDLYRSLAVDLNAVERVEVSDKELRSYAIAPGDLFFCRSSLKREGIGWCCYVRDVPEPAVFDCHVMRVRLNPEKADSEFVAYYWRHPDVRKEVIKNSRTATMTTMNQEDLSNVDILLPPLAEQKRIAAIAQKADRLRRTRRYALQLSDTYLQSVFLEMFGDPVTNPMGWQTHPLDKHLTFITSGARGWAQYYAPSGTRFIRSFDVQMNHISQSDAVFVKPPDSAETQRTQVQPNDVLLTITGSRIGRVAPVPVSIGTAYVSQHVAILRLDKSLHPLFLSMFLSEERGGQEQIRKMQYGQTKPGLNFDQIRAFKIPYPPFHLQEKFAQIVQKFERLHAQQREADRQAEHLFQTLLHRAFRGELTPQHANDEPASVLLEEIGAEQAQAEAEARAATQAMSDTAEYLGTKAKQQDTEPIQLTLPGLE